MPQLSSSIISPSLGIITKSSFQIKISILNDPNLKLILRPSISNKFPIMRAPSKAMPPNSRPKQISIFTQIGMPIIRSQLDHLRCILPVPCERSLRRYQNVLHFV